MTDDMFILPISALRLAAERAAADNYYLAYLLDIYQRAHGIDDSQVAAELKCSERDIYLISLCRQPDASNTSHFDEDILAISQRFNISAALLKSLVRKARRTAAKRATAQLSQDEPATTDFVTRLRGYDMAAQDREPDERDEGERHNP